MTGSGPSSGAALSAGSEREIAELSRRLGGRYVLDGTLGSLFAVEEVLAAVRRVGRPVAEVPWLPTYLGRLLQRAYAELGLPTSVQGMVLRTSDYAVDLADAAARLVDLPIPFPLAGGATLAAPDPRIGDAYVPHWFLGSLLRAQPIGAGGVHRDGAVVAVRAPEVRPWLARQHAWFAAGNHPRLIPFALRASETLAFPPFSHPQDPDGATLLHSLVQTTAMWPDQEAAGTVVRRWLTYQDRFVVAVIARLCLSLEIAPTTASEAVGLAMTLEPGRRERLWGPVREALDRLAPPPRGDSVVHRASAHLEARRHDEADRELFAAVTLDPENDGARRQLLMSWFSRRAPSSPIPRPPAVVSPPVKSPPVFASPPVASPPVVSPPAAGLDLVQFAMRRAQIRTRRQVIRAELQTLDDRAQLAEQVGRDAAAAEMRAKMALLREEDGVLEQALAELERQGPVAFPPAALENARASLLGLFAARAARLPPVAPKKPPSPPRPPAKEPAKAPSKEPAKPSAKEPTRIGPYEILGLLGEGGMGKVFRVRREDWGMELALKLPRGRVDDRTRARLVQETDAWAALGLHPFVATCYFALVIDEVPWIFAELVEGGSLADVIRNGSLYRGEPDEVLGRLLDVGWQTALGLHHAHERGLIHQDVKPGNVLIAKDGSAKVTDFGLARAGVRDESAPKRGGNVTMMAQFAGMTPAYCSPEQAAASEASRSVRISRRSDLWSWAASLLEVFVGELSWMFGPAAGAALTIYRKEGPRVRTIPRMPAQLMDLLERCFAKEEENRPQTLLEVADAIGEIHEHALGRPPRRPRVAAYDGADELYNRGTSAAALGDLQRALSLWSEALAADPQHAPAAFAHAVLRWRMGLIADDEAARRVDEVRQFVALRAESGASAKLEAADAEELVAWVQGERGGKDAALRHLDTAAALRGGVVSPSAKLLRDALEPALESKEPAPGEWCSVLARLHVDGSGFVAATAGKRARVLSILLRSGKITVLHEAQAAIQRVAASRDLGVVAFVEDGVPSVVAAPGGEAGGAARLDGLPGSGDALVAVAPDGRRVVTARGKLVVLHDLAEGGAPAGRTLIVGVETLVHVALSTKPPIFAASVAPSALLLLDAERGVFARAKTPGEVKAIAVDEGGEVFLATGVDADGRGFVGRWSMAPGAPDPLWLRSEPAPAAALALSPDGVAAMTLGPDGTLRRWATRGGRCLFTLAEATAPDPLGISLRGDRRGAITLEATGRPRALLLADALPSKSYAAVRPTGSQELLVRQQTFARKLRDATGALGDGRIEDALATLGEIRSERWSARLPEVRQVWSALAARLHRGPLSAAWPVVDIDGDRRPVVAVEILPAGDRVLVARAGSPELLVHNAGTGAVVRRIEHPQAVQALAISLRGDVWATAAGNTVRIQTDAGATTSLTLPWAPERLAVSGNGRRVVAIREAGFRVIDFTVGADGELEARSSSGTGISSTIHRASLSHDGLEILLATEEGVLRYRLDDENDAPRRIHEVDAATDVVWAPGGDVVLAGHRSGRLRRIALGSDQEPQVAVVGPAVTGAAASYDMRLALTVDASGAVGVWSLPSPKRVAVLSGHTAEATDVAITPSGQRAVTGGRDGRVRVWMLEWELVAVPEGRVLDARSRGVVARAVAAGASDVAVRAELGWAGAGHLAEDVVARAIAEARRG